MNGFEIKCRMCGETMIMEDAFYNIGDELYERISQPKGDINIRRSLTNGRNSITLHCKCGNIASKKG